MGRLVRDPEIRYTNGENSMAVAKYTLAVDRRGASRDGQQTADFIGCTAFGRQAEFAERYMHQGMRMLVSGRIQTGSYTKQDGTKVYTTDVIVDDQEFADSKNGSDGSGYSNRPAAHTAPSMGGSSVGEGFMNIPDGVEDEGLPFN